MYFFIAIGVSFNDQRDKIRVTADTRYFIFYNVMWPGDKNTGTGDDAFQRCYLFLSLSFCIFLSYFCLKPIIRSLDPDRGCPLTIDKATRSCWMLSRFIDSFYIPAPIFLIFFCSIIKIHTLVKQTIITREGKCSNAVIAIVRALLVCRMQIRY